ncbi:MAG: polysaccharide deacetylase [Clostridia bacterium]|nr:polysaccharide deacetylase [Clostridia bacterium]
MLYGYDLVQIEEGKTLNKKKVFLTILVVILVIAVIVCGIGLAIIKINNKKEDEQLKQFALSAVEEQKRLQEEEKIKKEQLRIEEEQRKKNQIAFTEEQLNAIENIYEETGEKRVFLTFDDGPNMSVTPFILDLLKQENIKATFFVLGSRAQYNPELIQREYNEGHYIANHSYSHVYREIYQDVDSVFDEYNSTEAIIQDALGNPNYHSKLFRFPGGSTGGYYRDVKAEAVEALRDNGIASLDWNALSRDAEGAKTVEELVQNVIDTVEDKESVVILMHDAADKILTYEALPEIIQYLRDNGYSFKNIYDIL